MLTSWWWVHEARGMCTCRAHDPFAPRLRCHVSEDVSVGRHEFEAVRAADIRRLDDLRACEVRRNDDLRTMERHYRTKLAKGEAKRINAVESAEGRRIDALLAADRANVSLANARAELTASNLAERVDTTAKAAAANVESSAAALRGSSDATAVTLAGRIAPLEQARYENAAVKVEKQETRVQSNWTTERIFAAIVIGVGIVEFVLRSGIVKS